MGVELLSLSATPSARLLSALLLGVTAFLLTLFCLELIVFSGLISQLWFATALMTVVAFRTPSHQAPLLGCAAGTALANTLILEPEPANLKFTLINLLQAIAGSVLLRQLLRCHAPLNTLLDWLRFMLSVGVLIPRLGGLLAVWMMHIRGESTLSFLFTWVIAESICMLGLVRLETHGSASAQIVT
ncbi:putative diguanylate cyclase YegE|uniref:MASE1 domain-containing protein n=1 Tax=Candidatus Pantoea persica TaxID=2518128 RepID=UPI00215DA0F0|nr:MASE1 domain-containing protein [Candidatus Pantoea persica]MBA2814761.1 putative diguanylate cyclase YegE [Candidatus Pantoea persica]